MPRLYSVAEANALLPELTGVLEDLQVQAARLAAVQAELQEVRKHLQGNGHGRHAEELVGQAAVAEHDLRRGLTWLQERDIELKDLHKGLIDFYHEREGRRVYLCWFLGEPSVAYWHTLEGGFAAREPL
ncbi:MAG TPA: DUF2203 domain-containing protein [Chloroflexia bacterium]|nr:DUF2203 domain-containing protein [Chloroflexia bacterium]